MKMNLATVNEKLRHEDWLFCLWILQAAAAAAKTTSTAMQRENQLKHDCAKWNKLFFFDGWYKVTKSNFVFRKMRKAIIKFETVIFLNFSFIHFFHLDTAPVRLNDHFLYCRVQNEKVISHREKEKKNKNASNKIEVHCTQLERVS